MHEAVRLRPDSGGIWARCMRGAVTLATGSAAERGARFIRNMILARILAPEQFGLMALVLASSQLFEALTEVGLRMSVIQNKKGDTEAYLNVTWWLSAARGTGLYGVGVVVAPLIAGLYQEPSLTALLQAAFLTMLLSGATSPRFYLLERQLQFGRYVWVVQGAGLGGTIVSLVAALFTPSAWALVWGLVAEAALRCAGSWSVCPTRLRWAIDRPCLRELLQFARGIFGLPLFTLVVMQADVFVLGQICSKETLGLYAMAAALASMPLTLFSRVLQPMFLPVLARWQDDPAKLCIAILRATRGIFTFGLPAAVSVALLAEPILALVYGRPYAQMGTVLGVLVLYSLTYMASIVVVSGYVAVGRPHLHRRFALIRALLVVTLVYPAARLFGGPGAAATLLVSTLVAGVLQLRTFRRVFGLQARHYAAAWGSGLIPAAALAGLIWIARATCRGNDVLQLMLGGALCAAVLAVAARRWYSRLHGETLAEAPATVGPTG